VLERRAARQFFRPSAFAELSTTAKPRTVGRVGSGQFDRSLRRSRVYDLSRARAARPVSIRRVARTNRVHWASRANACVQPGSCRAANADGAAGWDGRHANERARGRAAWPLV
jgi:hypothetical protein|tara:strand:- start:47 stop:385 length:339 start_codon:yes stop_codon:yes gene_type:complete